MSAGVTVALFGTIYFAFLGAVFIVIPRLSRPEVSFGVTIRSQDARRRALRYWNTRIVLLTAVIIGIALGLAIFRPNLSYAAFLVIPFVLIANFFYFRARTILLPFSLPSKKVSASLRRRKYRDYLSPWSEAFPLGLLILGAVATAWTLHTFPWTGHADLWAPKRIVALGGAIFPAVLFYPLVLLNAVLVAHSKQSVGAGDPGVCLAANEAFRKVWIRYFYALRVFLAAAFLTAACSIALANKGLINPGQVLSLALIVGISLFGIAGWVIAFRYGQGGWRWAVRKGLVAKNQAAAMFDGDGMPDARWKLGMFYFNPRDPSIIVEKRFGVGWTINFGNIWAVGGALVVACVIPVLLLLLF